MRLTSEQVLEVYPELTGFQPDGRSDYKRVVEVTGNLPASQVWAIVNAFARPAVKAADAARAARLFKPKTKTKS